MKECPFGGEHFDDEDDTWAVCSNCWQTFMDEGHEGDDFDDLKRFLRWMSKGMMYLRSDRFLDILARSRFGAWFIEEVCVMMEKKQLINLLRKIEERVK